MPWVQGFNVRCSMNKLKAVWFARDSGYSHAYAIVQHPRYTPLSGAATPGSNKKHKPCAAWKLYRVPSCVLKKGGGSMHC